VVIDTSAVVAILFKEPERNHFVRLLERTPIHHLSAVTRVECTCVVEGRKDAAGRADLERFLKRAEIDVVPVSLEQVDLACDAFRRFGKGRHPAGLNIGDCFAYALAKVTGEPLLFKGEDFGRTDLTAAA
jgi:ribonuclease VapC